MVTPHILSRDEILKAELDSSGNVVLPTETVEVPEWHGSVIVRGLSGTARDAFEQSLIIQRGRKQETNLANFRAKLVAQSVVDESGKTMFTEKDIDVLGSKSASALERVYAVAGRLSRLTNDDVEELTKALGEVPSDSSGSV